MAYGVFNGIGVLNPNLLYAQLQMDDSNNGSEVKVQDVCRHRVKMNFIYTYLFDSTRHE